MSDLIDITDEERVQLEHAAELLEGALSSPTGWINSTAMLAYGTLRDLATRKFVEPRATDPRIIMLSDEPRPFKAAFEEISRRPRTTLEALADLNAAARDLCEALKAAYLCPLWRFARRLLRAPREGER